jgi:hypothetical protein
MTIPGAMEAPSFPMTPPQREAAEPLESTFTLLGGPGSAKAIDKIAEQQRGGSQTPTCNFWLTLSTLVIDLRPFQRKWSQISPLYPMWESDRR